MSDKKFEKGKLYQPEWYVSFPDDRLNKHFKNGGVPSGSIMQVQSSKSGCFKSSISLAMGSEVQKMGHDIAYIDGENAVVAEGNGGNQWFDDLGVDLDKTYVIPNAPMEEIFEDVKELITDHDVKFVILDSVHSLQPSKVMESEAGKSVIGLQAKILGTELVKLSRILRENHATICLINHRKAVITSMGSFGEKAIGGKGLAFYSQLIIVNSRTGAKSKLEGKEVIDLDMYIEKNKFGKQFVGETVSVQQGHGIVPEPAIIDSLLKSGDLTKNGSWFKYKGDAVCQGKESLIEWVRENKENLEV